MNLLSVEVLLTILVVCGGVYISTGSIFGVVAVFVALCLGAYFLGVWLGVPLEFPVQFSLDLEHAPQASIGIGLDWMPHPASTPEVFYVAENKYTYKEAPNVCAVYDAQLASYEQLLEAHAKGAEVFNDQAMSQAYWDTTGICTRLLVCDILSQAVQDLLGRIMWNISSMTLKN